MNLNERLNSDKHRVKSLEIRIMQENRVIQENIIMGLEEKKLTKQI